MRHQVKHASDDDSQPDVEAHKVRHKVKHASDERLREPDVEAHLFKQ